MKRRSMVATNMPALGSRPLSFFALFFSLSSAFLCLSLPSFYVSLPVCMCMSSHARTHTLSVSLLLSHPYIHTLSLLLFNFSLLLSVIHPSLSFSLLFTFLSPSLFNPFPHTHSFSSPPPPHTHTQLFLLPPPSPPIHIFSLPPTHLFFSLSYRERQRWLLALSAAKLLGRQGMLRFVFLFRFLCLWPYLTSTGCS